MQEPQPIKVCFLNNNDVVKIKKEWQKDGHAGHQLWGLSQLEQYGIEADILPYYGSNSLKSISRKIKILGDIDQQIRLLKQISKYDLIYSGNYFSTSLLALLRRFKILRKPIVAISFQAPRPSLFAKIFARLTIAGNDKIICLSGGIKNHLNKDLNISPKRLELMEWGYDTEFHTIQQSDIVHRRNEGYVFSVGKTFRDYETLITAFKSIDFPLKIIGYSNNMFSCLEAKTTNIEVTVPAEALVEHNNDGFQGNQLPRNIKVVDKLLSTAQLLPKYQDAYAVAIPLILPDYKPHNTVGLSSLLEAMCMGKAIIVTENEDIGIDVERNGIGITVPAQDSLAWQQSVEYLLNNPEKAREMGLKARYLAEKKYNLHNFTQKIAKCIQDLVL